MFCSISGDRLSIDGRAVPFVPSPNVGGRMEPHFIVLHDTAGRLDAGSSVSWFKNPRAKVSAHLVIERDGSVTQMVEFDRCAWHAGKSAWDGFRNLNAWAIGIEIVNPGKLVRRSDGACYAWFGQGWPAEDCVEMQSAEHGHGWWLPYTVAQVDAVRAIVKALGAQYPTIRECLAHYHISPGRKIDVGPHFPFAIVAAGVPIRGLPTRETVEMVQARLHELGYQPGGIDGLMGPKTRSAIREFEDANGLPVDGVIDDRLRVALWRDPKGPVTAPRETATKAEVAAGSQTMQSAGLVKRATEGLVAANTVDALTSAPPIAPDVAVAAPSGAAEAVSQVDDLVTQVETARGLSGRLAGLIDWLGTPAGIRFLAVSAALGLVWFAAHRVEWRRWRDYVLGRHNGG